MPMCKKILLTFMVLMGAMSSWAGQVILDPQYFQDPASYHGNIGVDNDWPAPGATVTLNVVPDGGYCLYISDIVIEEYDANDDYVGPINPSGPPEAYGPEDYTFQMPTDATHNVQVAVTFTGIEYPLNSFTGGGSGHCEVKLINGQPLDTIAFPDPHNIMARTGDTITLKVTPDLGWQLNYINLEYQGNVNLLPNTEFIMPSDPTTVVAYFNLVNLTISINNNDPNGTLIVADVAGVNVPPGTPPPYIAHIGEDIALDFTANPGYILDHVDIVANDTVFNRTLINGEMNFDMPPCDITLIPTFKLADLTLEVDQGTVDGTIYARVGGISYPGVQYITTKMGRAVRLFNTPDLGYELDQYFVTLKSDGSDVPLNDAGGSNPWFNMPASDVFVTATFKPKSYNITTVATPVNNGNTGGDVNVVSPVDPNDYTTGNTIIIYFDVHPGYTFNSITVTRDDGGGTVPTIYVADGYYQFTMPPSNVTVTVNYNRSQYNINIIPNPDGNFGVTGGTPPYTAYVDDMVTLWDTPNPGYYFVKYILQGDDDNPAYNVAITTNTFQMPPHDVNVSVEFAKNQHKVQVQNVYGGTAEAWWGSIPAYDNVARIYNPIDYDGDVQLIVTTCNIGYVFSHFELYEYVGGIQGRQLTTLWQNPPDNTDFLMPDCDVLVVPVFLPKDYVLTVDLVNIPGGIVTATNTSVTPQTSISSGTINTTPPQIYGVATMIVHMGDKIQLSLIGDPTYNYPSLQYYDFMKTSNGFYIGGMVPSSLYLPFTESFTMPPCDLTISALIHDTWGHWINPTLDVQFWGERVIGGVVYLEDLIWLGKHSKSSPDEEEQNLENYGWARAVPGEPMHFVVIPDPGYQVRKRDITVRLLEVSQGEGGDEGKVLKEFKSGDDIEIFGPDEFVTELTEYYFIFDVPEGVDPHTVKVEIYADFTPVDYTITVDGAIEHGTITAPAGANADDIVTLTVTPEPGYRLESITVTPEEPGYLVTVDSNNQFVMPACNVTVTATFTEANFLRGDANGDDTVSIGDVTTLIDYLLSGDASLINMEAADCSQDGGVSIKDVTTLIDYLLSGNW